MTSIIRKAQISDYENILLFLTKAQLNVENIADCLENFLLVVDENGELKATIGFDVENKKALIRSLAILPSITEKELLLLIEECIVHATKLEVEAIYLLAKKHTNAQLFYFFEFQPQPMDDSLQPLLIKNGYTYEEDTVLFRKNVNNWHNLSTI